MTMLAVDINTPSLWLDQFHWPVSTQHKYHRGHVLVFGGVRHVGAARLSARAAARAGAGLVTLLVPQQVWPVYAASLMSTMAHPLSDACADDLLRAWQHALHELRWQVLVLGPGAGTGLPGDARSVMRSLVLAALRHPGEQVLVLDADALTAFEHGAQQLWSAIGGSTHPVVLTPHEGEFVRLFRRQVEPHNKAEVAAWAASQSGAVVVLKGAHTAVADPAGGVVLQADAPAWLATAGSGDVLTGLVAALAAQGLLARDAARMAVWLHAQCARNLGPGLISEDLPEAVPGCLQELKPLEPTAPAQTAQ